MRNRNLRIRRLTGEDFESVSRILTEAQDEYVKWFHPFPFDYASVRNMLTAAERDAYFGIFVDEKIVGFCMLRGLDAGYELPSYGVFIAESYARLGLSKLALDFALSWCRLAGIYAVMLKVHPDNSHAKRVYERAGFMSTGTCSDTGHDMLEIRWA